jgi:ferredoxin-nitrate reductase
VTVVHLGERLMDLQLDAMGAAMLERAMHRLGVDVHLRVPTAAIAGSGARGPVTGVVLDGGVELEADLVVVAAGVRPEVSLARDAGLEVDRAIVVDDELRTSQPGVHAVGECVQHRGVVYGLWAPLLEQAKVAGAALAGVPAAFRGITPATTLKVAGVDLFCGGRAVARRGEEEVLALDSRRGRYRRLVLHDGRLVGAVLLGDLRDARALRELLATGEQVPEALLEPAGAESSDPGPSPDPRATVCSCMSVAQGDIVAAIRDRGAETVEMVARHTRATTGCGGCAGDVRAVLEAHRRATAEPPPGVPTAA